MYRITRINVMDAKVSNGYCRTCHGARPALDGKRIDTGPISKFFLHNMLIHLLAISYCIIISSNIIPSICWN